MLLRASLLLVTWCFLNWLSKRGTVADVSVTDLVEIGQHQSQVEGRSALGSNMFDFVGSLATLEIGQALRQAADLVDTVANETANATTSAAISGDISAKHDEVAENDEESTALSAPTTIFGKIYKFLRRIVKTVDWIVYIFNRIDKANTPNKLLLYLIGGPVPLFFSAPSTATCMWELKHNVLFLEYGTRGVLDFAMCSTEMFAIVPAGGYATIIANILYKLLMRRVGL